MTTTSESGTPTWSRRLGEHVEAARLRAQMTRSDLADRLGVSAETIRRWERGGANPSPDSLAQLIAVLAIDGAAFVTPDNTPDDLPVIARRLRGERLRRGITQTEAGELIGVAQPTYAGWEIGRSTPTEGAWRSIAAFLGVDRGEVAAWATVPFTVESDSWSPLGKIVGERRVAMRYTRAELARVVRVSEATIVAWELGYRTPRPQQVVELAAAIQVDVNRLVEAVSAAESHLPALGQLIRAQQRRLGLRLKEIADRASLDQATLSRWIHGRNEPEMSSLRRLASALELPLPLVLQAAEASGATS